jgi:hypothetical protein
MTSRRVYTLIACVLFCIFIVVTGHIDTDWRVVTYHFDGIQNGWTYWEYCPFLRVNWWLAYAIDIFKIAAGWFGLGWLLNEVKHCLAQA